MIRNNIMRFVPLLLFVFVTEQWPYRETRGV